ncbi:MAG: hypothetical protein D6715_06270 [Calditrichaeota bacterium]|nr:MAG: hypothetical protein D6715_06270 [Calditrichota bacterium]
MKTISLLIAIIFLVFCLSCSKNDTNSPDGDNQLEVHHIFGQLTKVTPAGSFPCEQASVMVQYGISDGTPPAVTLHRTTGQNGTFDVDIPTRYVQVFLCITRPHFTRIDTVLLVTRSISFRAELTQLASFFPLKVNREFQYEASLIIGNPVSDYQATQGTESWRIMSVDTIAQMAEFQVSFNGTTKSYDAGGQLIDSTTLVNQTNTIRLTTSQGRLKLSHCNGCSDEKTILGSIYFHIQNDWEIETEHPFNAGDTLRVRRDIQGQLSLDYALHPSRGLLSMLGFADLANNSIRFTYSQKTP